MACVATNERTISLLPGSPPQQQRVPTPSPSKLKKHTRAQATRVRVPNGTHTLVLVEQPVTPRPRSYARNRRRHASRTRSTALGIIPRQQGPARTVVRPQVHSFEQESCASPRRRDSASTSQAMARLVHQNGLDPVRRYSTRCRSPSSVSCGLRC